MIRLTELEMRFGADILFSDVNLQFEPGKRYGLVGSNGSGKTTLLKLIAGQEHANGGSIDMPNGSRIGLLRQDHFHFENIELLRIVLMGRPRLVQALDRMQEILAEHDFDERQAAEYSRLETVIEEERGYEAESEAASILHGLGFDASRLREPLSAFSGGYKLRVLMAQALFGQPDILLLDEPTNHLDIHSIRWLEGYLNRFRGILITISHDRTFLDAVASHIADIDYGTIRIYRGNYTSYLKQIAAFRQQQEDRLKGAQKRQEELQSVVDRFKSKASKARMANNKERMIGKLQDEIESARLLPSSRRKPRLSFTQTRSSSPHPLHVEGLGKSDGEVKVLENLSFELNCGDRMAVIGPNGIGKSTLLKLITSELTPDTGHFEWRANSQFSYFPQDVEHHLDCSSTVLGWLASQVRQATESELRRVLGGALFSGDDVHKRCSDLSGG
ncbi:MAG: ABC-F family ATP-binding cassette domain-containing protein, partial [Planctomycetes bacterium]|nr:ABC-F family ATP-binding cassette domain-containing protein [Planctomycetota bacterium]